MNKRKSNLDEMQEQKLLKIEHNGVWFAFWGLLLTIIIQCVIGGENILRNTAGECIVFFSLGIYIVVASMKNGIWDRRLKPNLKTNIITSLIGSIACGIINFAIAYVRLQKLLASLSIGLLMIIVTFIIMLLALTLAARLYKKRITKLESDTEE